MKSIEKYIAWLENEIGYLEKKSNSQLDDKTANTGNKNFTKYARDLDSVGYYNGKKNGYSWCCVFPDAGRYHCFGMETALAMVGQKKGGLGAGVKYMAQYYKAIGRLFFSNPQRGDQIIFVSKDKKCNVTGWLHTEIVTKVENGKVYTIGGNTSGTSGVVSNGGGVFRKSYSINDPKIYGYGRPLWYLAEKQMEGNEVDMASQKKCIATIKLKDIEKMSIVIGNGRSLAEVKKAVGCDYIINGGVYDAKLGPVCHLKVDGVIKAQDQWGYLGYGWNSGPDIKAILFPGETSTVDNAICCVWLLGRGMSATDKPIYTAEMGGKRGRTCIALTDDSLILYCTKDGSSYASTPEDLQQEFLKIGATSALMLDGGGSSQCDFGNDQKVTSNRKVHNYICVWRKKVEPPKSTESTENQPDAWAKAAWDKAVAKGVLDGTRPRDNITRQELALVMDRAGLL